MRRGGVAILITLVIAPQVHSDPIADRCKSVFYQQTAAELAKKPQKKGSPRNLGEEVKLEAMSPSLQMMKFLAIESCTIRAVSDKIVLGKDLSGICKHSMGRKLSCYHEWLLTRQFPYSAIASIYLTSATAFSERDKENGREPDQAMIELIDTALVPLEKLQERRNPTFMPIAITPEMRKNAKDFGWSQDPAVVVKDEQTKLQKVETEVYTRTKGEILSLMLKNIEPLRQSKTSAAAIPALEERIKKLQAQKL